MTQQQCAFCCYLFNLESIKKSIKILAPGSVVGGVKKTHDRNKCGCDMYNVSFQFS